VRNQNGLAAPLRIRRLLSAAPLKLDRSDLALVRHRQYPPITLGGPIEALGVPRFRPCSQTYPPITLGGPIEACIRLLAHIAAQEYPPITLGGPIEAAVCWLHAKN